MSKTSRSMVHKNDRIIAKMNMIGIEAGAEEHFAI